MSTFGTIKARVSGEMKRGELSASATAVQSAVLSAIAYLERRRFPWHEFHDEQITASSSTTYVPFSRMSVTPIIIDSVKMVIGSRDYPLMRRSWNEIDSIDAGQWYGYPDYFAIHGENFRLYPPPNDDYVMKIAGVKKLDEVSAGAAASATNAWMTDGEELVRLTAKSMLFRDELRNSELANYFSSESTRVMSEIKREVNAKVASGRIVPTVI